MQTPIDLLVLVMHLGRYVELPRAQNNRKTDMGYLKDMLRIATFPCRCQLQGPARYQGQGKPTYDRTQSAKANYRPSMLTEPLSIVRG
jgi:hypothetical protein